MKLSRTILLSCFFLVTSQSVFSACIATISMEDKWNKQDAQSAASWSSGMVLKIQVKNDKATAVKNWRMNFVSSVPLKPVNQSWNAKFDVSDKNVSVHGDKKNADIPANGMVSFGIPVAYYGTVEPEFKDIEITGAGCEK